MAFGEFSLSIFPQVVEIVPVEVPVEWSLAWYPFSTGVDIANFVE